jgi:SAM-dependent methyltransferase
MDSDFAQLIGHDIFRKRLIALLAYRLKDVCDGDQITEILADKDPLSAMEKCRVGKLNEKFLTARIGSRVREIANFNLRGVRKYLDIGCGNGTITAGIGKHFKLTKENIVGCDITHWAGHTHENEAADDITFLPMEKADILPTNDTYDLITIFMALHHMTDETIASILNECYRVLAPNGTIIVREHDCPNHFVASIINIEHAIFEVVIEGLTDAATFKKTYFANYKVRREWNSIFKDMGFNPYGEPVPNLRQETRPYYQLYKKGKHRISTLNMIELNRQASLRNIPIGDVSDVDTIQRRLIFRH